MGLRGLATYLHENQRTLSKTLTLPTSSLVPLVVDGWSFIYTLHHNSNLPWVYGGEYDQFYRLVSVVVEAWIKVGFQLHFVFDGPRPRLKFQTLTSRLTRSHIQPSLLFFRTSSVSRGTSRFLKETRIIPPLLYTVCIKALKAAQQTTSMLEIYFADEEGDPYAVELAGRINGYVAGNDTDFVVLNSDGYLGYIPLDEMTWHSPVPSLSPEEEDGEFQTVRKSKVNRRLANSPASGGGVIPPDAENPTLSLNIYKPNTLAAHLKVPVTLLPLLGALVGNDFSGTSEPNTRNIQSIIFDRQLTLPQRISHAANTIRGALSPTQQNRKKDKHPSGSVMDLIHRSIQTLLPRSTTLSTGEIDDIIDKIVEATLQYAIPKSDGNTLWATDVCALHEPDRCPVLPLISRLVETNPETGESEELRNRVAIRACFLNAYRKGHLSPKIMDTLNSSTFWPRLFLENPDIETVGRSIGQALREWGYAIVHDAIGLPIPEMEEHATTEVDGPDSEEELVDVVESDSDDDESSGDDPLAPLKGQLQLLHGSKEEKENFVASESTHLHRHPGSPIITEYIRRGTRVAQEAVIVKPLRDLLSSIGTSGLVIGEKSDLPFLLKSKEDRMTVFLQILRSDFPSTRALPPEQMMALLCVRWILQVTHDRALQTNSKDRDEERWTKREARCFLAASCRTADADVIVSEEFPKAADRNVQLTAQVLIALESIEHLAQIMLLSEDLPTPVKYAWNTLPENT